MKPYALSGCCLLVALLVSACDHGTSSPAEPAAISTASSQAAAPAPGPAAAVKPVGPNSWPMFGGTPQRNMANTVEKNIAADWSVKKGKQKNIKWVSQLGNVSFGGPVIAGGRVFVGTNNERPRNPRIKGDRGILMCFRESDGEFLWQAVHNKLENPEENDAPRQGVISTPVIEGDRLYYVSNRCEVVCAATAGQPDTQEAKFLWRYDMIKELNVFSRDIAVCSPVIAGDLIFVVTGNGVGADGSVPAPEAPSFIALDKNKGTLVWKDSSPGKNIMDGQWSNPVYAEPNGKPMIIFPGGDGWLYAFEPKTGKPIWKFDGNPKGSEYKPGGRGNRNYIVATPVVHDNKLYVGMGQQPDHGSGAGHVWCIDITKTGDLSPAKDNYDPKSPANKDSGLVWHYGGMVMPAPTDPQAREWYFGRTLGAVAIHDELLYVAELEGFLHCLDARTGKVYWVHDFRTSIWAAPYYVDGKVYLGSEEGDVYVFAHGKDKKEPRKIPMDHGVKGPPAAANGVLYVQTEATLWAIAEGKAP